MVKTGAMRGPSLVLWALLSISWGARRRCDKPVYSLILPEEKLTTSLDLARIAPVSKYRVLVCAQLLAYTHAIVRRKRDLRLMRIPRSSKQSKSPQTWRTEK